MKASEVSQLTHEELLDKYRKFKEELFHLRFQLATGQLEKTHRLQGLRRDLARVLTFLNKHEKSAAAAKKAQAAAAKPAAVPKPAKAPKARAPKVSKAPKASAPAKAGKTTKPAKAAKPTKGKA